MGAAEIPHHVFFGVAAFLVRDDNATLRIEHGEPARHRFVIGEMAIAVQLSPAGEATLDIIERKRPLHVPRDLHALPRAQVAVNLAARLAQFSFDRFHFRTKIDIVLARMSLQLLQTPFQFEDRFFKIERLQVHRANR